ncbi:DNA-binding protein [Salicibibacter cibarius]|uniref:DNA-binding protein n=1 Tax=Salicibibacter cibarius TaxID=2743000 RepID=A0A7T6Z669_9BACI|nr:DNA-binding protein [Salicibibacter cibarius]QQK77442.1 DNA-binding protein [Salicibibacter cibarius]
MTRPMLGRSGSQVFLIGDGLKNFKNPNGHDYNFDDMSNATLPELIKEKQVHHYIGLSKEDAKSLIQEYPDIPHIIINEQVYYPSSKLREWIQNIGE